MGVPSLFKMLTKHNKQLFTPEIQSGCDYFFMDYNCLIHHCTSLINYNKFNDPVTINDDIEKKLITQVIAYTRQIVNENVKPTKLLYIAIDGPVPQTKLKRQRERRFKKFMDDTLLNEKKQEYGIESNVKFNSSKITPGTTFMKKLSTRIQNIIELNTFNVPEIIFSDASVPGEGEFKIFQYIREHNCQIKKPYIYGLDADLIVLCMASARTDVILCREEQSVNKTIHYLNLHESIEILMKKYNLYDLYHKYKSQILCDVVLILMLGGNDFVCPIEYLKIRDHGWETLFTSYSQFKKPLTDFYDQTIIWPHFVEFIQFLSNHEEKTIKERFKQKLNMNFEPNVIKTYEDYENNYYHCFYSDPHHPFHEKYKHFYINYFNPNWKDEYYEKLFETCDLKSICKDYLKSIIWCWNYYKKGIVSSWDYVYEYNHAPLIQDFKEYFKYIFHDSQCFSVGKCMSPFEQLMYVLPSSDASLLPEELQGYLTENESPIIEYYPEFFILDTITGLKNIYSFPLIPHLQLKEKIHMIVSNHTDCVYSSENQLNNCPFNYKK